MYASRSRYSCAVTSSCTGIGGGGASCCVFLRLRNDMVADSTSPSVADSHGRIGLCALPCQLPALLAKVGEPHALALHDRCGRAIRERGVGEQLLEPCDVCIHLGKLCLSSPGGQRVRPVLD